MKSCFGYIRVSTQKQGEGVSLQAQREAIEKFASQQGLTVTTWFEEKETAAKRGHPIFNQMLRHLKQGKATGLIMHKIDRSARNLRDWALISELPKFGVKPYFAADGLDFETRGGRLSANLQAVIAEDYIFNLREETLKGMNGRLKQGLFPWAAPPGYLDCGGGKPKALCPRTAPLIRLLFELYATRQYSYVALLQELHDRGLRNTRGGRLTLCGLGNILKNPFYIGLIFVKSSGQTYQGVHPPLVSVRIWQQVQDIRCGKSGPKITRHNHLFQGLFRCGHCQGPMVPEKQKGHVYYRCKSGQCTTKTIRENILEKSIVGQLRKLCPNKASRAWIEEEKHPNILSSVSDQRSALNLQIHDANRRLARIEDLLIDETISPEAYGRKRLAIQLQLKESEENLAKLPEPDELRRHHLKLAELQNNLVFLYELANREEKRLIIENVWPNRLVAGKKPVFEPYSWVSEGENATTLLGGAPERDRGRSSQGINSSDQHRVQKLIGLYDTMKARGLLDDAA